MSGAHSTADAARAYAARGWYVFPLVADTKGRWPDGRSSHLLTRGFRDASADAGQVEAWWQRWPDANIGLSLAASGLVALDADLYKPDCGWDAFLAGRNTPDTFAQESPRGGRHLVFTAAPTERFPGQLCPGVDVKHHGYILIAPSTFEGRPYRILSETDPAPCPDWIPRKPGAGPAGLAIDTGNCAPAGPGEVAELLSWIDPDADGYEGWVEVLQALHAHFDGGAAGLEIAVSWSRQGQLFRPGEIEDKWAGFGAGRGITLKSVARRARQNGANLGAIADRHRAGIVATKGPTNSTSSPDDFGSSCDYSHDQLAIELGQDSFDRDARYVAGLDRWFFWTGTHWKADDRLEHLTRIRNFLRGKAAAISPPGRNGGSGAKMGASNRLKSKSTVTAVLNLARGNARSATRVGDFDRDPLLLGTPDGTVDLKDGALRPARRSDLISRVTTCGPAQPGTAPDRWLSFLDEIMGGDTEAIGFLQRAAGYALTGHTSEHKLLFLHGSGRNGKSVFLNTLLDIWGDYGRRVAAGTFLSSHTERHPTDLASLRGARLAIASELPRGKCWDEAVIKDLTGGDRMTARFMRQDFFEFDPQLTLLIAGNVQPSFRGIDVAIRSRVVLVPFHVTIPPDRQDRQLSSRLKAEAPAILRWCIEGALAWQRHGLAVPERLSQASEAYFDDEDIVGQFLREKTRDDPGAFVTGPDLILQFNLWAEMQGLSQWSQTTLMKELRTRGYKDHRTSAFRGLKGLKLQ